MPESSFCWKSARLCRQYHFRESFSWPFEITKRNEIKAKNRKIIAVFLFWSKIIVFSQKIFQAFSWSFLFDIRLGFWRDYPFRTHTFRLAKGLLRTKWRWMLWKELLVGHQKKIPDKLSGILKQPILLVKKAVKVADKSNDLFVWRTSFLNCWIW